MAKPLKIVLIVFGALIALLITAAVALPLLFDPNSFRVQISDAVHKETGRRLEVGHIGLRVFPWLRVTVADARLGNAEGFGDAAFAEIRQLGVGVKLLPLLFDRQVQVSTLTLDGLRLNLAVDAQGRSNWQDLAERQQAEAAPERPADEGKSASIRLEDIDIGGIDISDAAIRFRDAQTGADYRVEPLQLKTGALKPGKPFDLDLAFKAYAEQPKAQTAITLTTTVLPDLGAQVIVIDKLRAAIRVQGEKIVDGKDASAELALAGDLRVDLNQQRIDTKALDLRVNGTGLDLTADGRIGLQLVADLAAQTFAVDALKLEVKAGGGAIPGGTQTLKLSGQARYDQKNGALAFDNGRAEAAGITVTTQLRGEGLNTDKPRLSGPLKIAPFSPRELLKTLAIPVETADARALAQASLDAQYSGSFSSAALRNLTLKLDQTTVQGDLTVSDFATQALAFALKADAIDADRYLPPKAEKASEAKGGGGDVNAIELPTEALEKLNANGTLDITRLKINGMTLSDVRLKLSGSGKSPKTQELSARLYGGSVNLNNRYSADGAPAFALKTQLSALNAAPFLQDFLGKDYVSGLGNLSLDLSSRGRTVGDLRKALNGSVGVKVENGAVKGFNLGQVLRQGQAMLAGQAAPTEDELRQTDFATLSATATIVNGMLRTNDLSAASPAFRLAGSGEIDLVNETINYLARPTVVDTSKGQGGRGLDELKGLTVPIKLTGNLFDPKYKLQLDDVLKDKAKAKIEDKLRQELKLPQAESGVSTEQQLKEKAGEKLGDLLFGRKPRNRQQPATSDPAAQPTPQAAEASPAPAP